MISFFFYFFNSLMLICAGLSIFSKNTVHSILFLILVFCNASGVLFLLNVEYLALVYIIVYVGAIAVLFLFVIMMLNLKLLILKDNSWRYLPIGLLIVSVFLLEIFLVYKWSLLNTYEYYNLQLQAISFFNYNLNLENISNSRFNDLYIENQYIDWFQLLRKHDNITAIGLVLYTHYAIPFMVSSLILFVAMIGAIVLTFNENSNHRRQDIQKQVSREYENTIVKIKTS